VFWANFTSGVFVGNEEWCGDEIRRGRKWNWGKVEWFGLEEWFSGVISERSDCNNRDSGRRSWGGN